MNENERFSALVAMVASRLAEVKATQEIILKAQATFLASVTRTEWEPIFEDLRRQAKEAADKYREATLREFEMLRDQKRR